jgi:1-deoxyxylulose-5-phosphate synthase
MTVTARLGSTDLQVSRIGLGCMSYGNPVTGMHAWTLDEDASQPLFRQAVELGVTFWDTANVYQAGSSEEFVGRAIRKYSRREDITLATKVFGRMHDGPSGRGLSRAAILDQVDASLHRLGTDYIDIYYIHRFDPDVPVEEAMEALHDIVQAGKVRYLGASSMFAWQFAKLQTAAAVGGWTPFVAMENQYNLIKREEEREMIPMCLDMGVGLTPYSPLGRGRLSRRWGEQTQRAEADAVAKTFDSPADEPIVNVVQRIAEQRGLPMAQIALAWVLRNPAVTAPIVGATKEKHLVDAVAALDVSLSDDEVAVLEAPYVPQSPYWYERAFPAAARPVGSTNRVTR